MDWYKTAILYGVDVKTYQDSNGDGIGDFVGLTQRLPYIASLGVTCIWLLPFYRSPFCDNGYDVQDYFSIDPRLGTLDEFIEFVHKAGEMGIRVIIDMVMNHTSDQHPWFQAARRDTASKFHDYYVWANQPPVLGLGETNAFPGECDSLWSYDELAKKYYYHRYYPYQPDLNLWNEEVRAQIFKFMDFWLSFGVAGFRIDSLPIMVRKKVEHPQGSSPADIVREIRNFVTQRNPEAVLLGEADVSPEQLLHYIGPDRLHWIYNFALNSHLMLAIASARSEPLKRGMRGLPILPDTGRWLNFLRNFDELNISHLSEEEQAEVYQSFAPDEDMRIYGRGIRRRLSPMLGDPQRVRMALSLMYTLSGSPLLMYGEEIGLGDDLAIAGREAVRGPMQWNKQGGFSEAPPDSWWHRPVASKDFSAKQVNVEDQEADKASLLHFVRSLNQAHRTYPGFSCGQHEWVATDNEHMFVHLCHWRNETFLAVHNLCKKPQQVEIELNLISFHDVASVFGDPIEPEHVSEHGLKMKVRGYGFAWFRVRREKPRGGAQD